MFFRYSAARQARRLGVTGWVRNLPDGRVETVIEGDEEAVRELVGWCGQGPPHATVEAIEVSWEPFSGDFSGFEML